MFSVIFAIAWVGVCVKVETVLGNSKDDAKNVFNTGSHLRILTRQKRSGQIQEHWDC